MSKLLSCPVPNNINPLSPNGFLFSVQRIPELTYFCQEVQLPSFSLENASVATPFVNYPIPGEKLNFSDLIINFLIDSEMKNYKAIFNWMMGLGFPENYQQYNDAIKDEFGKNVGAAAFSDATLTILNNTSTPIQNINFVDCFPVDIQSLTFTSTLQDVQYLVGSATFKYSYYKFS